ncbi:MAG: FmdB family zinc ribbon protein [Myxococcota bacterium]
MPTYDYQCEKCGFEFEREQRITEDPIKTCPECKGRKVKKLLSAPNFILKGGGWYADGYGSTAKKSGGSDSSSESSSSSSDASSSSSKSAKGDSGSKSSGKSESSSSAS